MQDYEKKTNQALKDIYKKTGDILKTIDNSDNCNSTAKNSVPGEKASDYDCFDFGVNSKNTSALKCRKCGGLIAPDADFCPHCGYSEKAEKLKIEKNVIKAELRKMDIYICRICGKSVSDNADFCPHCGSKSGLLEFKTEKMSKLNKKLEIEKKIEAIMKPFWIKKNLCPKDGGEKRTAFQETVIPGEWGTAYSKRIEYCSICRYVFSSDAYGYPVGSVYKGGD